MKSQSSKRRCQPSWLTTFLDYTSCLECPEIFLLWSGLQAISIALGRKVWRDMVYRKTYPNLFLIFTGPSGVGKSTAIEPVVDLTSAACKETVYIVDEVTTEAMKERLARNPVPVTIQGQYKLITPAFICATELTTLISTKVKYKESIIHDLTRLYDNKTTEKGTLSGGWTTIVNPYINLLGCVTPTDLPEVLSLSALGGGFAGRILFVHVDHCERCFPDPAALSPPVHLRDDLLHDLKLIHELEGPIKLTKEAQELYDYEYRRFKGQTELDMPNPEYIGYVNRKPMLAMKLAILLSVAERDDLVVTANHLRIALGGKGTPVLLIDGTHDSYEYPGLLPELEKNLPRIYGGVTRTEVMDRAQRVKRLIAMKLEVSRTELLRATSGYLDAELLTKVINTLEDLGDITIHSRKNPQTNRQQVIYRATKRLTHGRPSFKPSTISAALEKLAEEGDDDGND